MLQTLLMNGVLVWCDTSVCVCIDVSVRTSKQKRHCSFQGIHIYVVSDGPLSCHWGIALGGCGCFVIWSIFPLAHKATLLSWYQNDKDLCLKSKISPPPTPCFFCTLQEVLLLTILRVEEKKIPQVTRHTLAGQCRFFLLSSPWVNCRNFPFVKLPFGCNTPKDRPRYSRYYFILCMCFV